MLRDHPILGAGLRAYTQVMAPYVSTHRIPELYPHNVYLAMWSEVGLLGVAAFVALLVMLLWRGRGCFCLAAPSSPPPPPAAPPPPPSVPPPPLFSTPPPH